MRNRDAKCRPGDNHIRLSDSDAEAAGLIEQSLLETLRSELPQATNASFVLTLKDSVGTIVGGLTASTSYGWLLIKVLWVEEEHRGRGYGRQLVEAAERKAGDYDCHSVWLDTSHPGAMRFYLTLGFEVFGELSNAEGKFPEGHSRWFLKKSLSSDDPRVARG